MIENFYFFKKKVLGTTVGAREVRDRQIRLTVLFGGKISKKTYFVDYRSQNVSETSPDTAGIPTDLFLMYQITGSPIDSV